MNASKGLQRVSAVWWGFVGLALAALVAFNDKSPPLYLAVIPLAAAYGLHWLTCWMVKGFFGDGD